MGDSYLFHPYNDHRISKEMNFNGIFLGMICFVCIGAFHPIVIRCEYYFSYRIWPIFLIAGCGFIVLSALTKGTLPSAVLGVIGFCCLWSILELFHQHKRVEKGWFPANPKHHPPKGETR